MPSKIYRKPNLKELSQLTQPIVIVFLLLVPPIITSYIVHLPPHYIFHIFLREHSLFSRLEALVYECCAEKPSLPQYLPEK